MKVRFYNDTVRLRLTRREVTAISNGEAVSQTTCFSTFASLVVTLQPDPASEKIKVTFDTSKLIFRLPARQAAQWARSNEVGIETTQPIDAERMLHILIEKDFECLHGPTSENEDTFPNPRI